jgi:type II secretory pathway pseudopilin PulG
MGEIEQWFSYSEDDGFRRHASAEEAKAAAQAALDGAVDASGDGWPEDTDSICWGEVREAAVETIVHKHGPDCRPLAEDEGWGCTEGHTLEFDYVSRFDLTPTTRAGEVAEATARAEAAEQRAEAAEQRAEAVVADAQAAAHFCQSVAHMLASPGAEAEAVQHLRADDLPHLLDCLRERLAEAQPAEVSDV